MVNLTSDVSELTEKLPEEYKSPMEDALQKHLEYQFHSADYHTMLRMITGLKTILGHLIKVSAPYMSITICVPILQIPQLL